MIDTPDEMTIINLETGVLNYAQAIAILQRAEIYFDTIIQRFSGGRIYICTKEASPMDEFWLCIGSNSFEAAGWCISAIYSSGEVKPPLPRQFQLLAKSKNP